MSIDQIASEALRLPPNERALLAESLWESLGDPFKTQSGTDDASSLALADDRDRELETGATTPVLH
ncbi:MAG TPA: addiction module protein, partial [Roseimicrobium sp.]|nr:addiction module protein [Roseimicrobium sp.]